MESDEIFEVFMGRRCHGCAGMKRARLAFCPTCYRDLPHALRLSLWKRFGEGFEQAYQACLSWFRLHPIRKSPSGQQTLFGKGRGTL